MFNFDLSRPIVDFMNFDITQLGNAFLYGGSVLLIGMVTVFAVLCILWLFLVGFKLLFHDLPGKRAAKKRIAPVLTPVEKRSELTPSDEGELIAVIAAAIAMAEGDHTGMRFKVVSFKRV